jgi:hypothetical protein
MKKLLSYLRSHTYRVHALETYLRLRGGPTLKGVGAQPPSQFLGFSRLFILFSVVIELY